MDLAIFSGKPCFASPQHVGGPIVEPETRERFHRLADEAFDRNYLTNDGPLARRLEEEVAARHKSPYAILMNNATVAMMVLLKAMRLPEGEAIVSSDTFVSTAHVCEWLGLRPVFADMDPTTLGLDPADLEKRITSRTRLVAPTHVFGVFADMPALRQVIERSPYAKNISLVADAAHAFDCDRGGVPAGGFGVPEFLSFHATKFFSTIEGGVVLTHDDALAREMRQIRNFGFTDPGVVVNTGTNAKASEINAAFGLASLDALPERRRRLKETRELYIQALAGIPGLRIHPVDTLGRNNYRYFALFVEQEFGVCRNAVYQALRRDNVLARLYFYPGCHRIEYYRRVCSGGSPLPRTEAALDSIVCLPTTFDGVAPAEAVSRIADLLAALHGRAGEVEDWWKKESPDIIIA